MLTLIRAVKTRQIFWQESVALPHLMWQPFLPRIGICFLSRYKAEARTKFRTVRQPEQSLEDVGKSELRVFITVFASVFLKMKLAKFLVLSVAVLCLASLVFGQRGPQGRDGGSGRRGRDGGSGREGRDGGSGRGSRDGGSRRGGRDDDTGRGGRGGGRNRGGGGPPDRRGGRSWRYGDNDRRGSGRRGFRWLFRNAYRGLYGGYYGGYGGFYNTYRRYRYGHGYYTGKQIPPCILNLQFVDFVVVKLYMLVNLLKRC